MISIIIPILNEQEFIFDLLNQLFKLQGKKEIILVDGGSTDKTLNKLKIFTQKKEFKIFFSKEANRAAQMNLGAKKSKGDILWFLHSDSKVHPKSLFIIQEASKKTAYGCFKLVFFGAESFSLKIIAYFSSLRVKFFSIIFGDQAMFVRKDFFNNLCGFKPILLMEDWEFSQRAKKLAKPILLKQEIKTSSRKFLEKGVWRACFLMQKIKFLYLFGVSPEKLKVIYYQKK